MNINEFNEKYFNISQKHKVFMVCQCGKERFVTKEKAEINILDHGEYICRACSMRNSHKNKPRTLETKEKQRLGRLGKKQSNEAKVKMANAKKLFYQTDRGKLVKQKLSYKAVQQHSKGFNHGHMNGYFPSKKSGNLIYFGSSYELRSHYLLDNDPNVEDFESQVPIKINERGRCLDCFVNYKNGIKEVREIKPKERLVEENVKIQIQDNKDYAQQNNYNFKLWTEDDSGFVTPQEITKWAMNYILNELKGIDHAAIQKQRNCEKAKRHYDNKISQDKVAIFCEFCQEEHTPLRKTYEKAIKKKGRYICEREGGKIAGSKPKKKKFNPYAIEGKKQCNQCKEIKLFEEFGIDKFKSDGYSTRCKKCRSAAELKRYYNKLS